MKRSLNILVHIGLWLVVFIIPAVAIIVTSPQEDILYYLGIIWGIIALPASICFYSCYYYLFPKYIQQQQIKKGLPIGFSIICFAILLGVTSLYITNEFVLSCYQQSYFAGIFIMMTIGGIFSWIAVVLRGFATWYNEIQWKEELQQKNFEIEMKLVKSQLDPHFLFNTLNNIDILIEHDAKKASRYLNELSDIMRFMLFETKVNKIPLEKEITYIRKYIDLQKIRTANPTFATLTVIGDPQYKTISPMVFIPFIENAFKHTSNKKIDHAIEVSIEISDTEVRLYCHNKLDPYSHKEVVSHGLGNNLISKRLALLYPNQHELEVAHLNNAYNVNLRLQYA